MFFYIIRCHFATACLIYQRRKLMSRTKLQYFALVISYTKNMQKIQKSSRFTPTRFAPKISCFITKSSYFSKITDNFINLSGVFNILLYYIRENLHCTACTLILVNYFCYSALIIICGILNHIHL